MDSNSKSDSEQTSCLGCFLGCLLLPFNLLGMILLLIYAVFESAIRSWLLSSYGVETYATVTRIEDYQGDGLHPIDTCYKGDYEFRDRRGRLYKGYFSGMCFDPFDLMYVEKTLDEAVQPYQIGSHHRLVYVSWKPSIHDVKL